MNPAYMVAVALSAFGRERRRAPEEDPMQYLCLIYDDEKAWERLPPGESARIIGEFQDYTDSVKKSGHYLGGNALAPPVVKYEDSSLGSVTARKTSATGRAIFP